MSGGASIVVALVGVYVLVELLCAVFDVYEMFRGVWRWLRGKKRGAKVVAWPQDLQVAAANGLVGIGSELVVGEPVLWENGVVKRFTIAAADCGEEAGTVLKVVGMNKRGMEVVRVGDEI